MVLKRDFLALLKQLEARQAGRPHLIDSRLCFVAMPFRPEMEAVYDVIQEVVTGYCGLKCVKADDIATSNRITDDIRDCVKRARIVVADLTGCNPNVFYEVGLAHGREKRVILMRQPKGTVPFDLSDIRGLEYDVNNLAALKSQFVQYLKNCISTIPHYWNRNHRPRDWNGAYIKITSVVAPTHVRYGQPINIRVTAKNTGSAAKQGYFSVSFPDDIDDLRLESNIDKQVGLTGDPWGADRTVLDYPIAEAFLYGDEPVWRSGKQCVINVMAYPKRRGLLWYYLNACCYDSSLDEWRWDPDEDEPILDIDQREEPVYCGVIDVQQAD